MHTSYTTPKLSTYAASSFPSAHKPAAATADSSSSAGEQVADLLLPVQESVPKQKGVQGLYMMRACIVLE